MRGAGGSGGLGGPVRGRRAVRSAARFHSLWEAAALRRAPSALGYPARALAPCWRRTLCSRERSNGAAGKGTLADRPGQYLQLNTFLARAELFLPAGTQTDEFCTSERPPGLVHFPAAEKRVQLSLALPRPPQRGAAGGSASRAGAPLPAGQQRKRLVRPH